MTNSMAMPSLDEISDRLIPFICCQMGHRTPERLGGEMQKLGQKFRPDASSF